MSEVSTIGLDLAKKVFQVHGADAAGAVVFRKRLRRNAVLQFFAARAVQGREAGQRPELGTPAGRRPSGDGQGAECTAGPRARAALGATATAISSTGSIRARPKRTAERCEQKIREIEAVVRAAEQPRHSSHRRSPARSGRQPTLARRLWRPAAPIKTSTYRVTSGLTK